MGSDKKYPCKACRFCQFCPETRCRVCRGKCTAGKKMSIREQIELFDRLNAGEKKNPGPVYYRHKSGDRK